MEYKDMTVQQLIASAYELYEDLTKLFEIANVKIGRELMALHKDDSTDYYKNPKVHHLSTLRKDFTYKITNNHNSMDFLNKMVRWEETNNMTFISDEGDGQ